MKKRYLVIVVLTVACIESRSQVLTNSTQQNPHQILLPYNRLIQPAGLQIFFGDDSLENHSLDAALSPDGKWLAVQERYSIVFIRTSDNKVKYKLANNDNPDLLGGMNTYSGIIWHTGNEGTEVYWSTTGRNKRSFVVSARWDGIKAEFSGKFEYKAAPKTDLALPNEILITKESLNEYLYVVLNGNNKVIKQDLISGDTIWVADPVLLHTVLQWLPESFM